MALCIMWTGCIDCYYDDKEMSQRLFPQSVRMVNVGSVNVWGTTFLKLIYACCFSCVLNPTRANAA